MTLTVRLDAATESALDRYCAERGVTRSLVVQESLAVYLLAERTAKGDEPMTAPSKTPPSANYRAFAEAGFIGAGALGGGTADKAAVRAMAMKRLRRNAK
ncbi:MAG: hypothetical protein V4844_15430 [Pseudomonadota bacterium]|jgi:hypothetical protein